ncbi:LLM class F420-dependent oxidoreductase [Pseudofrankia inefficax]|uniref:Putative F420-dependent oxidoreductase n=1 Tax=Pseudofrankia inefficax (strain DSM 45817 / CECT 9037 / DDB 130130 / EuI1c) TaxID=298654 RepID=E3IU52_PSEI1|nr:LLM class F420-dependent oxidoreductase [Pseudofrankia inefficax]ADP81245.1 putative F420-dependent oxidoreductase [Pseudofrankia inefficax]
MGKFGVRITGARMRDCKAIAEIYEDAGFESIWVPDHLALPVEMPTDYPYRSDGTLPFGTDVALYDPWLWLSYLAAATERVKLATGVFILPLRHPLPTARSLVTLDRLSGGRAVLGIGVGWLDAEFDWVGQAFKDRGRRTDATIRALRALWTEDVTEVHDEFFDFGPTRFRPKPVHRSIPIEIGGKSAAALRRTAELGDGWIEVGSRTVDVFGERVRDLHGRRAELGRTGPFEVTVSDRSLLKAATGFKELFDAGATRIVVDPPRSPAGAIEVDQLAEWAKAFARDNILPLADA